MFLTISQVDNWQQSWGLGETGMRKLRCLSTACISHCKHGLGKEEPENSFLSFSPRANRSEISVWGWCCWRSVWIQAGIWTCDTRFDLKHTGEWSLTNTKWKMAIDCSFQRVIDAGKCHVTLQAQMLWSRCLCGTHPVWGTEPRSQTRPLHDPGLPMTLIGCGGSNKDINSVALNSPIKQLQPLQSTAM